MPKPRGLQISLDATTLFFTAYRGVSDGLLYAEQIRSRAVLMNTTQIPDRT